MKGADEKRRRSMLREIVSIDYILGPYIDHDDANCQ